MLLQLSYSQGFDKDPVSEHFDEDLCVQLPFTKSFVPVFKKGTGSAGSGRAYLWAMAAMYVMKHSQ